MMRHRLAFAALLAAPPAGALAQTPAAAPVAPAARPWQVDWGRYYCSVIRKAEADRPFATAFVTIPGRANTYIALVPDANGRIPTGVSDVVLLPAGRSFHVGSIEEGSRRAPYQKLYDLPVDFLEQLAGAEALELRTGRQVRARVPLGGVRAALTSYRRCVTEVAAEWGVDLVALAALSRRPESTNALGFRVDDYPVALLASAIDGRVVLRVDVSAEARATGCAAVASSGSAAIDSNACQVVLRRARFTPALDAAGRAVAARAVFLVTFRRPQE